MVFHVDLNAVAVLGSDFFPARCRPPSGDRWLISTQVPIWSKDDSQERLFGVTLRFSWGLWLLEVTRRPSAELPRAVSKWV